MRRQRGVALIVVAWIVILLSLWAVLFLRESAVQGAAAGHAASRYRARLACDSALEAVRAYLAVPENQAGPGELQPWADNPEDLKQIETAPGHFAAVVNYDLTKQELRYGLSDEASRLNLLVATREQLMALPGMTEEAAEAIIDWRDADNTASEKGAEAEFYALLANAYEPKNGQFETLQELLLVKGIDPILLYGDDWNLNGRLDRSEDDGTEHKPDDNQDGQLDPGLWRWLTLYSYEKDTAPDGQQRVNINSATPEELTARLGDALSPQQIQRIPTRRPFSGVGHLTQVNGIGVEDLLKVVDRITTSETQTLVGRINVITAPREVLLALGLSEEETDKLVNYRAGKTEGLDTLAWLVTELGEAGFRKIANLVTVKSFQYRFQVQGWVEGGTAYARRWYVVDRVDDKFRVLHARDLHRHGRLTLPEN